MQEYRFFPDRRRALLELLLAVAGLACAIAIKLSGIGGDAGPARYEAMFWVAITFAPVVLPFGAARVVWPTFVVRNGLVFRRLPSSGRPVADLRHASISRAYERDDVFVVGRGRGPAIRLQGADEQAHDYLAGLAHAYWRHGQ